MVNMLYDIIILKSSTFFYVTCNHMTMTVTCDIYVTVCNSYV